ncbi:hypothetical protein [Streptomyces sp. NPDC048191]|uniref:hypothetical protein n=1 Tax=Streptomyces sp. NPDC048191 TaxID=3155484 RepID=UPI0033EAC314
MSRRTDLLLRAARAYAEAGAHADAARCYDGLGRRWNAADSYHRAGDLEHAAETYRKAGHPDRAADCYRLLGRPDRAARCWQDAGRPLEAGWELLLAGRPGEAGPLLATAARNPAGGPAPLLRLRLAGALHRRLAEPGGPGRVRDASPLLALLTECEELIPALSARAERMRLLDWGVAAADRIERFDRAAALFEAAYRPRPDQAAGRAEVLARWQEWAAMRLGDTAWLPAAGG